MIRINKFSYAINNTKIINDISFSVENETISLIGPSGCGKSTLLKAIINKEKNIEYTDNISYVPQDTLLFPWMTLEENILFNLDTMIDNNLIEIFNLQNELNKYPYQASIGTKVRVNLLRAYTKNSKIMLLDEPFNGVDEITKIKIIKEISEINKLFKKSIILVTHNIEEAILLSDRILLLQSNPMEIKKEIAFPFPNKENIINQF